MIRSRIWWWLLLCVSLSLCAAPEVSLTPAQQAWLDEHPQIVLGISDQFQPDVILGPDGRQSGLVVDYLRLLNGQLGGRLKLHVERDWAAVTEKAMARTLDGLAASAPNATWDQHFLYTDPLYQGFFSLYRRVDDPPLSHLEDLAGRRVGYLTGMKKVEYLLAEVPEAKPVSLATNRAMADALISGEVDALIGAIDLEWWRRQHSALAFRPTATLAGSEHPVLMSIRNDWPELVGILNKALRAIPDEERARIYRRWFGDAPVPAKPALALATPARNWLAAHPEIRFAVSRDWAPIGFYDREDHPAGIAPDYLARISELLGVHFEPVAISDWPEAMTGLVEGHIDLLPAMAPTAEREQLFRFTTPYVEFPIAIFARVETPLIDRLDALAGQRVILIDGHAVQEWLQRDHPDIHLVRVRDAHGAVRALAQGQGDALVGNLFAISQAVAHEKLFQIRVAGETPYSYRLAMAARPDWAPLIEILNQALAAIPGTERDAIQSRWLRQSPQPKLDYALIWRLTLAAALGITLVLVWNLSLRRQIRRRVHAERVLAESEQRYRSMVESAGPWFHFYALGLDSALLDSTSSLALFGIEPERLLGMKWGEIAEWTPDSRRRSQETLMRCLRGEVPPPIALDYTLNGRPRYLITYPRPVCAPEGHVIRIEGITVDLTEQRALEAELREAKHRAEAASRAKGDFLANMSHEIRTPMNAVLGMLHLALQGDLDERLRHYLDKAQSAARHLLRLLNDILDLSKVEANQMRIEQVPFSLGEVLESLTTVIAPQAREKGLGFEVERLDEQPEWLMGDPLRLSQILTNLAGNAVKFTHQGEVRITVRPDATVMSQDDARVALEFIISDTGIGLDTAMLERLFQPFQQADSSTTRRYGGTGLGLSICKRLLELMHGSIEVSSTPGVGSRFSVRLGFTLATAQAASLARTATLRALPEVNVSAAVSSDLTRPAGSPQDLIERLDTLAAKAARHDASIEDDFRAARSLLSAHLSPADYRALADAIAHYRFAVVRQLIARWQGTSGA